MDQTDSSTTLQPSAPSPPPPPPPPVVVPSSPPLLLLPPPPPPPPPPQRIENTDQAQLQILNPVPLSQVPVPATQHPRFLDGPAYGLPQGWMIELRPRNSPRYIGKVDQFFYEPGTKKQFRSLKSVEEHLGMYFPALRGPMPLKHDNASRSQPGNIMPKRRRKNKRTLNFDFVNAPESITWDLTDVGKDEWSPFVQEVRVPDDVRENWIEVFHIANSNNAGASYS